jgi:hypothetical protein
MEAWFFPRLNKKRPVALPRTNRAFLNSPCCYSSIVIGSKEEYGGLEAISSRRLGISRGDSTPSSVMRCTTYSQAAPHPGCSGLCSIAGSFRPTLKFIGFIIHPPKLVARALLQSRSACGILWGWRESLFLLFRIAWCTVISSWHDHRRAPQYPTPEVLNKASRARDSKGS